MIKAVCFDLDGIFFTEESFKRFKKRIYDLTENSDIVNNVFHGNMMNDFKIGKLSENEYWNYVRKSLNLNLENNDFYILLRDSYEVNEDVVNIVKMLNKLEIQTCICSNNFKTRVRELDKKFDFLKLFKTIIFSYDIGYLKPNTEIFQELIKQSNLNSNEILYSDDNDVKLKGAKELGIVTFVYESMDLFIEELIKKDILLKEFIL